MLALFKQLLKFARVHKKFWLVPAVVMLVFLGGLVVLLQSSTIAPFIYAIF